MLGERGRGATLQCPSCPAAPGSPSQHSCHPPAPSGCHLGAGALSCQAGAGRAGCCLAGWEGCTVWAPAAPSSSSEPQSSLTVAGLDLPKETAVQLPDKPGGECLGCLGWSPQTSW